MRASRVAVLSAFGSGAFALGQPLVGPQRVCDPSNVTGAAVNETSMACSDADPSRIIGGWNDYRAPVRTVFTRSFDGGQTWSDGEIRPPAGHQTGYEGDPMTAWDSRDGTLYAGGIGWGTSGGVYVARLDPGETVFRPSVMARIDENVDKGWMTVGVDPDDSSKSRLYIAYNEGVSRSSDRGDTWEGPVSLGTGIDFLPRVGPSGTLYVAYWDTRDGIWLRSSTDGGRRFGTARRIVTRMDTWGNDGSRFPGQFRVPPTITFAVDPVTEALYLVYFDTTRVVGGNHDVDLYFTRSTDGGATWSAPKIINGGAGDPQADSFFPWLEVDRTGRLGVVYYDTRNGHLNDIQSPALLDTYFLYSENGGLSWGEVRLTPTTWSSQYDGGDDFFLGDYLGMAEVQGAGGSTFWPLYLSGQAQRPHQYTQKIYFPCPGDFNQDGAINTIDVLGFLNQWNRRDPRADFNHDGSWNTLDVLLFLNAWNAPCP